MHLKIVNREDVLYIFLILMTWDLSGDLVFVNAKKGKLSFQVPKRENYHFRYHKKGLLSSLTENKKGLLSSLTKKNNIFFLLYVENSMHPEACLYRHRVRIP